MRGDSDLPSAGPAEQACKNQSAPLRRVTGVTLHQQRTQRTLLDSLRVEYGIEKPSNKLLALTDLDSNTKEESRKLKWKIRATSSRYPPPAFTPRNFCSLLSQFQLFRPPSPRKA